MKSMKAMKKVFGRSPQAKGRRQLRRSMDKVGEMSRKMASPKGMKKLRAKRSLAGMKNEIPWKSLLGLVGGAVGLAAFMAIGRFRARSEQRRSLAQSGQSPGRSHIQLSSHPATQSRYQPSGRQLGSQPGHR